MKPFLIYALFLYVFSANAQNGVDKPFTNANVIVVKAEGIKPDSLYKTIARVLLDRGYTIDRSDASLLTLTTANKLKPNERLVLALSASVNKGAVMLSGRFTNYMGLYQMKGELTADIEYRSRPVYRHAFDEMDYVANLLAERVAGVRTYASR